MNQRQQDFEFDMNLAMAKYRQLSTYKRAFTPTEHGALNKLKTTAVGHLDLHGAAINVSPTDEAFLRKQT